MHNTDLQKRKIHDIEQAIERAKAYAQEQGVPLTAERLAAELDMDLSLFHRIVRGEIVSKGRLMQAKVAVIQRACGEATASVMEHAMQRGTSPNMHMVYLKNNAGYDLEKSAKTGKGSDETPAPPVIFVGEEAIPD
ncbi:MAG: hypothetical protein II363_03715 [Clostridia bacterium]|nr:hypothetical protein [Clostridia bacterium]